MKRELSPHEKLAAGRLMSCERMPYFASALHALTPVEVAEGSLDTFGVLPNSVLLVDLAALRRWKVDEVAGVLVHEGLHIIRDHDARRRRLGAESYGECRLWNLAADCEINDDLKAAGLPLPGTPVFPKTFKLEDGQTAEQYYGELRKLAQKCPHCRGVIGDPSSSGQGSDGDQSSSGGGGGEGDDEGDGGGDGCQCGAGDKSGDGGEGSQDGPQDAKSSGKGQGKGKQKKGGKGKKGGGTCPFCHGPQKPEAGGGWCGSGGGLPVPGEPEHKGEADAKGRSEVELNSLRRRVAEAIKDAVEKSRGTVPAGLARWADEVLQPPRVDWRTKLAQVARTAVAFRPGAVDFRYHRPSRRQGAIGLGIGKPVLPAMIQPVPRVGIAVDTSGSMSSRDLTIAVEESAGILGALGADVDFIACDASVGAVKRVRTPRELAESLVGGGGTDFAPVFDAVEKLRPRPEVLVYITDGCGPAPLKPPPGLRTIWVLVGQYRQTPHFPGEPWGEIIELDDLEPVDDAA